MKRDTFLFDNLAWFEKKLCSVMTSVSADICEASKGGYTTSAGTDWRNQM
jgi:hypothetical protein